MNVLTINTAFHSSPLSRTLQPQDAGSMVEALKAEGQGGWALGLLEVSFKLKAHEHYCPMDDLKVSWSVRNPWGRRCRCC
jgi:hypothetical protein